MEIRENIKKQINEVLLNYIEKNVFPVYNQNDGGHGIGHIYDVINRSFDLLDNLNLGMDRDIVFTIAAYHDIGRIINDEEHEKESAKIFLDDQFIASFYDNEKRKMMAEAIEDHRASIKYEPRSDYGKLVSSADRNHDVIKPLIRTYQYRLKHNPDSSLEEKIKESYDVLKVKFGEKGYAEKVWYDDGVYKKYLADLRNLMNNYEIFTSEYIRVNGINKDDCNLKKIKKN